MQRVGVRYIIPDPPTSPSLISLHGFCGRKTQSFLSYCHSNSSLAAAAEHLSMLGSLLQLQVVVANVHFAATTVLFYLQKGEAVFLVTKSTLERQKCHFLFFFQLQKS